jgi:hypothetical protein
MKKYLVLALLTIGMIVRAQDIVRNVTLPEDKNYLKYSGVTTDTIGIGQDSVSVLITVEKKNLLKKYSVRIAMLKVSGTPNNQIQLQGKVFEDDSWNTMATWCYSGAADSANVLTITPTVTNTMTMSQAAGTIIYDTTKLFSNGANLQSTFTYDTTKIMNHLSPALKSLYAGTVLLKPRSLYYAAVTPGAYTVTSSLTDNGLNYHYLRVLIIHKDVGTKSKISKIELRVWYQ